MTTITGAISSSYPGRVGPFEHNGNLYVLSGSTSSSVNLSFFKSTNSGASWSQLPNTIPPSGSGRQSLDAIQAGSVVYVVYGAGGGWSVSSFDLSTETWGTQFLGMGNATGGISNTFPLFISRRDNGDIVVAHQAPTEKIMGTDYRRAQVHVLSASSNTWGEVATLLSGTQVNYDIRGVVVGVSGRIHVFYTEGAAVRVRTYSSANSLISDQSAIASTAAAGANYTIGNIRLVGSNIVFYTFWTNASAKIVTSPSSDTPVFTDQSLYPANATDTNPGMFSVATDGTIHLFYAHLSNGSILYTNDQNGGGWTTPVVVATPTNRLGISANLITNAFGLVYRDLSSVVHFEKVVLAEDPDKEGSSTTNITVDSMGSGVKYASGGSVTNVTAGAVGQGEKVQAKEAVGGSATNVVTESLGQGAKHAVGGSVVSIEADEVGGGRKVSTGSSITAVEAGDTGVGTKTGLGASVSVVGIDTVGSGTKHTESNASTDVTVESVGVGSKIESEAGAGGSTSAVAVSSVGEGYKTTSGAGSTTVDADTVASGTKHSTGGFYTTVDVTSVGAGTKAESEVGGGGSTATVGAAPVGQGFKGGSGAGVVAVTIDDEGVGYKATASSSTTTVEIISLGGGFNPGDVAFYRNIDVELLSIEIVWAVEDARDKLTVQEAQLAELGIATPTSNKLQFGDAIVEFVVGDAAVDTELVIREVDTSLIIRDVTI